jgi:hypothetical protein
MRDWIKIKAGTTGAAALKSLAAFGRGREADSACP